MRVSIRYKMLGVISTVLFLALGSYLYLAVSLFTKDKLAYVFDLTSSLVGTHADETGSHLSLLGEKLILLGRALEAASDDDGEFSAGEALAQEFLDRETGIVRVELYRQVEGKFERVLIRVKGSELDDLRLDLSELETVRAEQPIPLANLRKVGLYLQNSSLPPDGDLLTIAIPVPGTEGRPDLAVVADVRTTRLLPALGRAAAYTTYLVDRNGIVLVHPDPELVVTRADLRGRDIVQTALDSPSEQGVREFELDAGHSILGAYARVGVAGAAVITEIPRETALQASDELIRRSLLFGIAILLAAFVASILFSRLLTRPIIRLQAASRAIGEGRFDVEIDVSSNDEIGELATALRDMTRALQESEERRLESEKAAAFSQVGAGFAHEIQAPLNGIIGDVRLAKTLGAPTEALKVLDRVERTARKCGAVLQNFLRFSQAEKPEMVEMPINEVVLGGLKLAESYLDPNVAQVVTNLHPDTVLVEVNMGQMNLVLVHLLLNAEQAMPEGGTVTISTSADKAGAAVILVTDTGPGIPPKDRMRIFEPFFTTKAEAGLAGLGLSISQRIVKDHGGTIGLAGGGQGRGSLPDPPAGGRLSERCSR